MSSHFAQPSRTSDSTSLSISRQARVQWNGGQLMDRERRRERQGVPQMGALWNPDYMPCWREEMSLYGFEGSTSFDMWATVHDVQFWQAIGKRLGAAGVAHGLQYAAAQVNVHAFEAMQPKAIGLYVQQMRGPIRNTNLSNDDEWNQLVLMELTPPTGVMDLYAMAVRVKHKHREAAPDMLVLPTLSEPHV